MGESSSVVVAPIENTTPPAPNPPATPPVAQATPPAAPPVTPQRPAWLPEKFSTPEQLAEAYGALETKLGTPPAPPATPPKPVVPVPTGDSASDPLAAYEAEFAEHGQLSEDSYGKLQGLGFSRRIVDNYIEGARARGAQEAEKIHGIVGGAESFKAMAEWAGTHMGVDEVNALNTMFAQGGAQAQVAARSMMQAYTAANGGDPQLLDGSGGPASLASYESYQQLMADMGSEAYKFDPAFRKKVQDKLARSNNL